MATTKRQFGQTNTVIKGKHTSAVSATSQASILSNYTKAIPVGNLDTYSDYNSFCKVTVQTNGDNILGKTFHYIESSPVGVDAFQKPKCYSATITSVLAVACGGLDNTGMVVNLVYQDGHNKISQQGVSYQGYDSGNKQKFFYPNFHVADHNENLYPPPNGRLQYTPPGQTYVPPPDPTAAPSPNFTGCTSISATNLNNGEPTWLCWCDGNLTFQKTVEVTDSLDDIIAQHGNCTDVPGNGDPDPKFAKVTATYLVIERSIGEDASPTTKLDVTQPYEYIQAYISVPKVVNGLTNIYKPIGAPVFGNPDKYFGYSYVYAYIKMKNNVSYGNPTADYFGIYIGTNNRILTFKMSEYFNADGTSFRSYELPTRTPPVSGSDFYAGQYSVLASPSNGSWSAPQLTQFFTATTRNGLVTKYGEIPFRSHTSYSIGSQYIEIGVEGKRFYPDSFVVPDIQFSAIKGGLRTRTFDPNIPYQLDYYSFNDLITAGGLAARQQDFYRYKSSNMCVSTTDLISGSLYSVYANYNNCNCTC